MDENDPTMEESQVAWQLFLDNLTDIRACVEKFTQNEDEDADDKPAVNFTIEDFDAAVQQEDRLSLFQYMNEAWQRSPDDPEVYDMPGFREMSDLLDGSVPGFIID